MMRIQRSLSLLGKTAVGTLAVCTAMSSLAAQQCIASAGTYGAITVTQSAGCIEPGFNPYIYDGMTGFAIGTNPGNVGGVVCTLGFSHPVVTASVSIDLSGHNPGDDITLSTSAGPYAPVNADLNPTPIPGSPTSPSPLSVSGNVIVTAGTGSGTFHFTNAPPASITSITLNHMSQGAGTFVRVCLDDASTVVAQSPTPVPVFGLLGLLGLSSLIGGMGAIGLRRRSAKRV